ncbi:MAG: hypothetical protein ACYCYI_02970 [Saccharofermentanales bacterium]
MQNESETFPIYIILIFMILLIASITVIQNLRIDNLKKEIETIKVNNTASNIRALH